MEGVPGVPGFERWTPPDFSDLEAVARALEAACPEAAPVGRLRVLGEGFFSVAVATASRMVFRLGTSPDVFARYQKEWRVLLWLASKGLPLEIPRPRWLLEPGPAFPFGGIGYPLIEGRTLTESDATGPHRARLVEQIAAFNLALHRLPVEEAFTVGVPDGREGARAWHKLDREISTGALAEVLTTAECAEIERWWERYFEAFDAHAYTPLFTHSDIGDDNLIVDLDGTSLTGVIDFEHCAVGDPFDDFDGLQDLGRDFLHEAVASYARAGGTSFRDIEQHLEWRWQRGAFPSIRRAWQRGDPIEADEVRAKLRRHRVLP